MKLSIVIVNYNVRYFLEQCLLSVRKAMEGIDGEVFVVDNNSVDGSVTMVRERFPWVKLIANTTNTGFSKANNQAMRIAGGQYILLLNPDTVIEEDTLRVCIRFMDEHPDAGGLGVRMVDGKGRFLPESKRGLPTPETSFYKIFGVSRLFPGSRRFNRYYLGHLSNDETHEIEILSGAFMFMRKEALDKVGLLDEAFFMYGEDIDLSWRIIQGGYRNYYLPDTRIIHYKGESTKKGSLNYVFVFYNAMVIFARKHFSEKNARLFSFFIHLAIWLRAGVAVLNRTLRAIALPAADAAMTLGSWWLIKQWYASSQDKIYDDHLVWPVFAASTLTWLFSLFIAGAYDRPLRPASVWRPWLTASLFILVAYSLLPESMRFSRALILLGSAAALASFFLTRMLARLLTDGHTGLEKPTRQRIAIVGGPDETERVATILSQTNYDVGFIARVAPGPTYTGSYLGDLHQLNDIVRVHAIDQVVFCAKDVSSADIISAMSSTERSPEYKIAPPESLYIIGSNSIETSGDVFILDVNSVSKPVNRRKKRILDIAICLLMLPILPALALAGGEPAGFVRNWIRVAVGRRTWVGFCPTRQQDQDMQLPRLRMGIVHPLSHAGPGPIDPSQAHKLNVVYAKDYRMRNDLSILLRNLRRLGQSA